MYRSSDHFILPFKALSEIALPSPIEMSDLQIS